MLRPALLLLALLTALPAAAEIYSWKDKDGKMHYADVPPATGEVKTLRGGAPRPAPPAAPITGDGGADAAKPATADGKAAEANAKPKTLAERELEFRQRRAAEAEAEAKAEKERADSAERQRACEQARNQLTALTSGQRVSRFDAAGGREVLDDAGRAEEIARTQKQVDQLCN